MATINLSEEEKFEILLEEQAKYRENLDLADETREILRGKLSKLAKEHKKHGYQIVYSTDRIKTENSYLGKVYNKIGSGNELSYEYCHDIVGFRVICLNKNDAEVFKNYIVNSPLINVIEVKNYVDNPKDSGYRSFHIIVEVPIETIEGIKNVRAEIQVRTLLMDIFAREEHKLNYKCGCSLESQKKLKQMSRTLNFFEDSLETIVSRDLREEESIDELVEEEFNKIAYLYDSTRSILMGKLNSLIKEYPDESDIAYKKDRIKPLSSISRKLKLRHLSTTSENIRENITDVVGFKIVCINKGEVEKLVEYFKKSGAFDIVEEKDYLSDPKDSGYRGYHMKVRESIPVKDGTVSIVSEIQVRTMLMDAWAMHDDIVYGNENKTEREQEKLAELSAGLQLVSSYLEDIKKFEKENMQEPKRNFVKELEEYRKTSTAGYNKGPLILK